jgi:CubicO group peptidase (beta-lactamase class C family)
MAPFALAAATLLLAPPRAPSAPPVDAAAIDALLRDALKAWQVPGAAVAVVHGDEVVYLKGVGVKDLDTNQPVTPDTLFPIASCTKAFTTTAMALLVDEGKMSWDDPVRKHLEYFRLSDPLADANVTLRDLVTHRTGVAGHDFLWYRAPWTQEEAIRKVGRLKLERPFRSAYQYQTTMFTAAGHAVARAAGATWADFVQQRIFDPLGMTRANFTTPAVEKAGDYASGHRRNHVGQVQVIPWYAIDVPDPAGSINASARDLSRWLRFHLGQGTFEGKQLISAASLRETHTPQIVIRLEGTARAMNPETTQMSYGMGWVIQDYRGHRLLFHAGLIDGFRAYLVLAPDAQLGLVLLNNLHQTWMNLAVANNLVDLFLGLPRKDWNAYVAAQVQQQAAEAATALKEREAKRHHGTRPSRELAAYTGLYEEPAYGTARVSLENGLLVWRWSSFTSPLEHVHYDTFVARNDVLQNPRVVFTLGADGNVATMKVLDLFGVDFKKVAANRPRKAS